MSSRLGAAETDRALRASAAAVQANSRRVIVVMARCGKAKRITVMRTRTGRSFERIDRNHLQVANADFLSPGCFLKAQQTCFGLSSLLFVNSYVCYFAMSRTPTGRSAVFG